ncbi:MAG: ABC transporter ATP-binding protein [Planctomycetota bacterium]|jgi:putative ABC transport system ATP-binding protein
MLITIKDLTLEYRSGAESLKVLDIPEWSVDKGEQVAISGPSGSGKSTLINVISGLLSPTAGSVQVAGTELTALGEAERDRFRARTIGYIFQNFNLLQGYTALENVLLGLTFSSRKVDRGAARELLAAVGLSQRMTHYPSELSIGEQQRVAIARALAKKPELLLADEPTGSLDPLHTADVVAKLREISRDFGCTLIVVSHEEEVVSSFDKKVSFLELNRAFAPVQGGGA